jgi:hypothetical protein
MDFEPKQVPAMSPLGMLILIGITLFLAVSAISKKFH